MIIVKSLILFKECKWKLDFVNNIFYVNSHNKYYIRRFLLTKICKFERMGYKFTNISEMNMSLI